MIGHKMEEEMTTFKDCSAHCHRRRHIKKKKNLSAKLDLRPITVVKIR